MKMDTFMNHLTNGKFVKGIEAVDNEVKIAGVYHKPENFEKITRKSDGTCTLYGKEGNTVSFRINDKNLTSFINGRMEDIGRIEGNITFVNNTGAIKVKNSTGEDISYEEPGMLKVEYLGENWKRILYTDKYNELHPENRNIREFVITRDYIEEAYMDGTKSRRNIF